MHASAHPNDVQRIVATPVVQNNVVHAQQTSHTGSAGNSAGYTKHLFAALQKYCAAERNFKKNVPKMQYVQSLLETEEIPATQYFPGF